MLLLSDHAPDLRLLDEQLDELWSGGEVTLDQLQGAQPARHDVSRTEHHRHGALSEPSFNLVASGDPVALRKSHAAVFHRSSIATDATTRLFFVSAPTCAVRR